MQFVWQLFLDTSRLIRDFLSEILSRSSSLGRFLRRQKALGRAAGFVAVYAGWIVVFRLFVLSLITYVMNSSLRVSGRTPRFEEVSDALASNELGIMGLGACFFVLLLKAFDPLTGVTWREIFPARAMRTRFAPGLVQGAVLAVGLMMAFVMGGSHRYLGFFFQYDEVLWAATSISLRVVAIVSLAYFEELIFRRELLRIFQKSAGEGLPAAIIASYTAVLYVAVKWLQFDLGFMQALSLFLLSVVLSLRTLRYGEHVSGAGFVAALLLVFHPGLSLPIFGNEFSGFLLVRYQAAIAAADDVTSAATRFFTGGAGGPLSGLAFQLLLLIDIARSAVRHRKILLNPPSGPIR